MIEKQLKIIQQEEKLNKINFLGDPGVNIANIEGFDEIVEYMMPQALIKLFLKYLQTQYLTLFHQGYGKINPNTNHIKEFLAIYLVISLK